MNRRDELIASLEKETTTSFLELAVKHYSKADPYNVQEIVEGASKDCSKSLWRSAESFCKTHLLDRHLLGSEDDDVQQEGVAVLRGLAALLSSVVALGDKDKATQAIPLLELLHGLLPLIPNSGQEVQNSIAKIFEKWWQTELPLREHVVPHTVPYLIIKTIVHGSVVSDIQRLWAFRQAMLILDFEDSSSDHLKSLLLQCLIHPLYIQTEEGRRFLSFLFGLHPTFTDLVHSTIKQNIPNCPRPFLESYGEVYFRAWRASAGVYLEKIENDCLQDLMHHAVHAQRSGPNNMSAALLKLLGFLHQQKVFRGMDNMLLRLYDPILWRALKVANVCVRANAASLLIDAFPLQNSDSTREENDELLQKQINVLLDLLADPAPLIRTMGVTGICRVLGIYWELIPSAVLQTLLKRLIKDMTCDVSASAVRAAVFQGLSFVVENPLSHPIMAKVLPELKLHIHDTSERVRLSFIQLLLTVRNVRTIKFWDVVPMEHLLHRLAVDRPSIVRPLVKLLYISYQPVSKEGEVQLARCVELLRANPAAARKFYQFVHLHMSTSQAGKFILFLCRTLRGAVEGNDEADPEPEAPAAAKGKAASRKGKKPPAAKGKGRGGGRSRKAVQAEDKDEEVDDDSVVAASTSSASDETSEEVLISGNDESLVSGLLECMVIVWQSILLKLKKPGCKTLSARLEKEFSAALPEFFNSFKSSSARAAILLLSSNVPAEAASALSVGCLEMFRVMQSTTQHQEYAPIVDACCSWGHVGDLLTVLHAWLKKGLHPDATLAEAATSPQATRKKGSGRKKKTQCAVEKPASIAGQEPVAQACFALDVLTWMLVQPSCRAAVLSSTEELETIIELLKSVLDVVEKHVTGSSANHNQATERLRMLRSAFCMYTRLQVHLHAQACKEQSTTTEDRSASSASPVLPRSVSASGDESLLSTLPAPA
ncbi:condensin-2 complex subunit G2-like [Sycon ciliatum]|uniref:condensin-2 complex subunit G2-like n=1 Tax=Sycon ciliatum TaxID=27933 RepID=UPI0031F606D4